MEQEDHEVAEVERLFRDRRLHLQHQQDHRVRTVRQRAQQRGEQVVQKRQHLQERVIGFEIMGSKLSTRSSLIVL